MKNQIIDSIETTGETAKTPTVHGQPVPFAKTPKPNLQSFEGPDTEVPPVLNPPLDRQPKTQTEIQREGMVGMAKMNYYRVAAQFNGTTQENWIMTMNPMFGPIPPDMAIQLAAWLVKVASENGATVTFNEVWEIVKDVP